MPVTSMIRLARVDFETTDPAQLRAAVRLPQVLQPLPHSMVLRVAVAVGRNAPESRDFVLREIPQPVELAGEVRAEERIFAYRLDDADVPRVSAFRSELIARKRDGRGGVIAISVVPRACKVTELPDGPILFTTYLRTAETVDYVTVARDVDLRTLLPGRDIAAYTPRCGV